MTIPRHVYIFNEVFNVIKDRLWLLHNINIFEHIDIMHEIGVRPGQGITFRPVDSDNLKSLLKWPSFTHDNRNNFCERLASAATRGKGYRETGSPSLHFQIAASYCNIHLDNYGFVTIGPNGIKYYNPDSVQHIVDELVWGVYVVEKLDKKAPMIGSIVGRFHPILPNSRNRHNPAVGGRFDVVKRKGWALGIDTTISITGERRVIGAWEVYEWK